MQTAPITDKQRRAVFAICRQHKIDDDTRHAAIKSVCRKDSLAELSKEDATRLINHLLGHPELNQTKPKRKANPKRHRPAAVPQVPSQGQLRLIGALALARITEGRMTETGFIEWGTKLLGHWPPRIDKEASRLIETLKSMNERDGLWIPER